MKINEEDLVLGTIIAIEGTTATVKLDEDGEGTIAFSEISPGRIRNIREFVSVGKKVVCKVLRVRGEHLELSLRRVTTKEKEEVLERHKKERALFAMINPICGDKTQKIIDKIKEEYDSATFADNVRTNPAILEKFVSSKEAEQLAKLFTEKKEKEKQVKTLVTLKTLSESGLTDIQHALDIPEAEIHYEGSSKFSIIVQDKDFKGANHKRDQVIEKIRDRTKKSKVQFEILKQ